MSFFIYLYLFEISVFVDSTQVRIVSLKFSFGRHVSPNFFLITKKDIYSKGEFVQEKHKTNQKLQRKEEKTEKENEEEN